MIKRNTHNDGSNKMHFIISRLLQAPVTEVFAAWTNEDKLRQWWGPHHFTNPVCEMDVRTGGRFLIHMKAPDGALFPMKGIYHQVEHASRLVFTTTAFEDENGNSPLEYLNRVSFSEDAKYTIVIMEAEIMKMQPGIECLVDGIWEGWHQSFEKLELLFEKRNFNN